MNLTDVIQAAAHRLVAVSVHVDSIHGTVAIHDTSGAHSDIFLQGSDASAFISNAKRAWHESSRVALIECYLWQAEQLTSVLWEAS